MKISAKGRYGLAAMSYIAQNYRTGSPITIISIAEKLGISKIYLEQVFSLLKRAGLVTSIKGAQGGYQLVKAPSAITVYDILGAIELALVEKAEDTVKEQAPALDKALQRAVFEVIDSTLQEKLQAISLQDILNETEKQKSAGDFMYFI
ncbi:MAG: RrF2 family transcriptional regulator [Selenomonadaceae bacterium]